MIFENRLYTAINFFNITIQLDNTLVLGNCVMGQGTIQVFKRYCAGNIPNKYLREHYPKLRLAVRSRTHAI